MKKALALATILCMGIPSLSAGLTIYTNTNASSKSGGVSASYGETVTTGPNSSSVHIQTVMTGSGTGATSSVEVKKTENGVSTTEKKEYYVPELGFHMRVNAGTKTDTKVQVTKPAKGSSAKKATSGNAAVTSSTTVSASTSIKAASTTSWVKTITQRLRAFFSSFFAPRL